jgi:hypothetical protein
MLISIINHTHGKLPDDEVQTAIRAVNRQVAQDFEPHWSMGATLRLDGRSGGDPDQEKLPELRGDAVIYLWDKTDIPGALGYHDRNYRGIPFGFVFTDLAQQLGESWTVTLSHEVLELIADPYVNILAMGPHPERPELMVFHWYEMSDAVQAETYQIDGIAVSNFVLPLYFTLDDEAEGRNDFLGTKVAGESLKSFGVNPGGYIGFYNPETGQHETYSKRRDNLAQRRMSIKAEALSARRAIRYQRFHKPADAALAEGTDDKKRSKRPKSQGKRTRGRS